jgi:hypothetical protein
MSLRLRRHGRTPLHYAVAASDVVLARVLSFPSIVVDIADTGNVVAVRWFSVVRVISIDLDRSFGTNERRRTHAVAFVVRANNEFRLRSVYRSRHARSPTSLSERSDAFGVLYRRYWSRAAPMSTRKTR